MARRTKRLWTDEEKRSICLQTTARDVSVAQVARRYSMNANLIFTWLRDPRYAPQRRAEPDAACFLPVEIADRPMTTAKPQPVLCLRQARSRLTRRAATGCGSAAPTIPRRWPG